MANFSIVLPASLVVESRKKTVSINIDSLSVDIVAKLVLHGLTQKIGDSAASATKDAVIAVSGVEKPTKATFDALTDKQKAEVTAKAADIGLAYMEETVKSLESGVWGATRTSGPTVTPLQTAIRNVARGLLVPTFNDASKAKWKELNTAERNAKLDEIIAKQKPATLAAWTKTAEADIEAEKAKAARAAELAGDFSIDL